VFRVFVITVHMTPFRDLSVDWFCVVKIVLLAAVSVTPVGIPGDKHTAIRLKSDYSSWYFGSSYSLNNQQRGRLFPRQMIVMRCRVWAWDHGPPGARGLLGCSPPTTQNWKLKNGFCRYDGIKSSTWFSLQPKSSTETVWWLVH
jgi:hypothetical protein